MEDDCGSEIPQGSSADLEIAKAIARQAARDDFEALVGHSNSHNAHNAPSPVFEEAVAMTEPSSKKAQNLIALLTELQDGLIAQATGGAIAGGETRFLELRVALMQAPELKGKLPAFLRDCRDVFQFWQFIKHEFGSYAERRKFLWDSLGPLISDLEEIDKAPANTAVEGRLASLDAEAVSAAWLKALARRNDDPEGAITAARTLLESVFKHLLEEMKISYDEKADLPKLYAECAKGLNLAPDQHTERSFKAILGNCQAVVNELGSLRNKISDAHGHGRLPIRPAPRHAELAVNLAGSVAAFLVATWIEKKK